MNLLGIETPEERSLGDRREVSGEKKVFERRGLTLQQAVRQIETYRVILVNIG